MSPKDTLFRINRDVRFARDRRPYKTTFNAAIRPPSRHSGLPAYYLKSFTVGREPQDWWSRRAVTTSRTGSSGIPDYVSVDPRLREALTGSSNLGICHRMRSADSPGVGGADQEAPDSIAAPAPLQPLPPRSRPSSAT